MGILDFPPSNLDGSSTVHQFTIGTRLVVNLSWQPGATATGVFFSLESCTGSACSGFTEFATDLVFGNVLITNNTAYFLDGYDRVLTPSTIYRYRVRNQYAGGYSTYSNIFEITLPAFTPDAVPPPGTNTAIPLPPSGFAAGGTGTTIDLTWLDNSNNESGFIIERYIVDPNQSQTVFDWQIKTVTAPDVVFFSDTGLIPQTTYYYRIKSYNQYGESAYDTIVSKTTDAVAVANLQVPTLNSAVVEQSFLDPPQVVLSWTDNSSTETAFLIERRVGVSGPFSQIFVAAANSTTYTDTNVIEGGFYTYRLRAYRSSDTAYSGYSGIKSVTVGEATDVGFPDGFARKFDAVDDRLVTDLVATKGSTNKTTVYAWVKKDTINGGYVFGKTDATGTPNNASLSFYVGYTGTAPYQIDIRVDTTTPNASGNRRAVTFSAVNPLNTAVFVAFVNDVDANRARFYWGFTVDTIVEIDEDEISPYAGGSTATQFSTAVASNLFLNIGTTLNNAFGGPPFTYQFPFEGVIDSVGIEFDTVLTLASLKDRARCGIGAGIAAGHHYWPITGQDPEEGITEIVGTTIVAELCDPIVTDGVQVAGGYAIAHADQDGDANIPSTGGVIRDNQMKNNGSGIMSANIYLLQDVTIDNPGAQNTYIRRGTVIYE